MDRLILFRHGKAEPDSESGDDFDRRLAPGGVRASAAMGETLAGMGFSPDLALVSSAARARETWEAAAPAFPDTRVEIVRELYLADPATILRVAKAAEGRTVMVVGHNPGLQDLTVRLLIEGHSPMDLVSRAQMRFPTAAASVFLIDHDGGPAYDGLFYPERGG